MLLRRICPIFALLGASLAASGAQAVPCGPQAEAQLQVAVQGVRSGQGNVTITVYGDRPEDFLASGTKLVRHRVPANAGVTRDCLPLPGPGTYAVAVYHDEDDDHDFDRNFIGLPTEGFGLSNNPRVGFSIPDFEKVRFQAGPGETELAINLKY